MLTSITPLGERSRGQSWRITTTAFLLGGVVGGAAIGAVAGELGSLLTRALNLSWDVRLTLLAVVAVVGIFLELRVLGTRLPTIIRQVNEDWLHRYRGWVYGVGFGFQLGTGIATIVSTSAVYTTVVAAVLSGSGRTGVAIGIAFGLLRSTTLLGAASVNQPYRLSRLAARLDQFKQPARLVGLTTQGAMAAAAITIAATSLR